MARDRDLSPLPTCTEWANSYTFRTRGCVTAGENPSSAESDVQVRVRPLSGLSRRRQSLSRNESALLAHSRRMAGRHGRIERRRTIKTTPLVRHAMVHLTRNPPPLTRLLWLVADCGLHQLRSNSWTAEAKRGDGEDAEDSAELKNRAGGGDPLPDIQALSVFLRELRLSAFRLNRFRGTDREPMIEVDCSIRIDPRGAGRQNLFMAIRLPFAISAIPALLLNFAAAELAIW